MLRLCSGSAPACSPSAQVKAAVAHVRRLKRNQRKGKLILSLRAFGCVLLEVLVLIARGWSTDNTSHACGPMANHPTACWVETFKEARRQSPPHIESRSFADNMSCVEAWRGDLLRESPDPMFSKLLYAVCAMMTTDPTDRPRSVDILYFLKLRNWQEEYKEQLVDFRWLQILISQ
jgi:hypothetical protein